MFRHRPGELNASWPVRISNGATWAGLAVLGLACGKSGTEVARPSAPVPVSAPSAVSAPATIPQSPPAQAVPASTGVVKLEPVAQPQRPLTTAEIVAHADPSVALIAGAESSGTGFLVRPGLLVTNAHVIDGEIVQNLDIRFPAAPEGRRGPFHADLVDQDTTRDLAFLAVATNLPALEVAQSHPFRKGEDITVIGSPGIGPKRVLENAISRGVLSTEAELDGRSFYQLGIAVNPGNSGGPVLDSAGLVIGVVTLKAQGEESLAFSIPVEDLQRGIARAEERRQATGHPAEAGAEPELKYGWKPGQVLVYSARAEFDILGTTQADDAVSIYTVKAADADKATLAHRGWVTVRRRSHDGGPPAAGNSVVSPDRPHEATLEVSRRGILLSGKGDLPLPMLGDLAMLMLDPLPERPSASWDVSHSIALEKTEPHAGPAPMYPGFVFGGPSFAPDRFGTRLHDRLAPRFGRVPALPGRSPFSRIPQPRFGRPLVPRPAPAQQVTVEVTTMPARELIRYRVGHDAGDAVPIIKSYELTTTELVNGEPRLAMKGDGRIVFASELGVPRELTFQGMIVETTEYVTVRLPIKLTCRLLEGLERDAAMIFPVLPATPMRPITEEQLAWDLADINKPEDGPRRDAAHRLADAAPIKARRADIARALEGLLDDKRGRVNVEAIRALGIWGDIQSRKPLIERLHDEKYDGRAEIVEALGRLGPDPASAEAIAACLGVFGIDAPRALEALGPGVEPTLQAIVKGPGEDRVRVETCRVLGKVGTQTSVPLLEGLVAARQTAELGRIANEAAQAIRKRNPTEEELSTLKGDLASSDGRVRHQAMERLAQVAVASPRQAEIAGAIEPLLTDRDGDTQAWAVRALKVWGGPGNREALRSRVADKDFQPWREAVSVLAQFGAGDGPTTQAIAAHLSDDPRLVCETWKKMGPVAEPAALEALDNSNADIRREACGVLAVIGSEKSVPKLEPLARDKTTPFLDGAASEALKAIAARSGAINLADLLPALGVRDIFRRGDAIRNLLSVTPTPETRAEVARVLETRLDPKEAFGQEELYKALAVWGDDQTRARLVPLVADKENRQWAAAMEALITVGPDEQALRAIVNRLVDDPRRVGEALQPVAPKAEPFVIEMLANADPRLRVELCRWLGSAGSRASLPALEALSKEAPPEALTQVAEEALKAIQARP